MTAGLAEAVAAEAEPASRAGLIRARVRGTFHQPTAYVAGRDAVRQALAPDEHLGRLVRATQRQRPCGNYLAEWTLTWEVWT